MPSGSSLKYMLAEMPDRAFDVGIAEQHAVTLAAGLACGGKKPVVAIYSTFLQRAYDQLVHDVAIQNLPVLFAIDRAGLVGPDGATHAGSFDFSFMRCLPNVVIMAPANENECRQMLYTGYLHNGPASVRYPRGGGPGEPVEETMQALPIGKAALLNKGKRVALLAFGTMVEPAMKIGSELGMTVVNMRFVKPLDTELIEELANSHEHLVTLEENAIAGGAGAAVVEYLSSIDNATPVQLIGLPDEFIDHGDRGELLQQCGLHEEGIRAQLDKYVAGNEYIAKRESTN